LARQIEVLTPENIPLILEPAGIGSRFGAMLVDLAWQVGIFILLAIFTGILTAIFGWSTSGPIVEVLMIVAVFLLVFGYFILFETVWNGQTPGKRSFGLRVLRDGGRPVDFFSVATRNLVRVADFLPVSYAIGAGAIFFHPQYKRLGDMAAGTIVVRERGARTLGFAWGQKKQDMATIASAQFKGAHLPPTTNEPADVLTPEEMALMRRFAIRRWEMTPDDAERMGYRIIVPLVARLNLSFVEGAPPLYANLISTIVAQLDRVQAERDAGRTL